MPQDTLRSVVYRSFVPCDDPNGVVECGTIRKSKTSSRKVENSIVSRRTQKEHSKGSNPSSVCEDKELVSGKINKELQTPTPSQLLEVSRGAQKINQMIDSWSKRLSFDGQSKDIAGDLLNGALDLQESLIMLGKRQQASKHMVGLGKKQGEEGDEVGIEGMDSDRFGDEEYQMGLQKPRLSIDRSSRNCSEELKKLIRDSLSRQNLLPTHSIEEMACWSARKMDSELDIPSTSSRQSSILHSMNSGSADISVSSATQEKRVKAPNLIAKLLGLDELPSKPIQSSKRPVESEKSFNQRRPTFDIDMPKLRKPQFVDPERKTLKEIIETMQFKGLLKSNHVEGRKLQFHLSDTSSSKQRLDDENPPIVIIKPLSFPCVEKEGPQPVRFIWEEKALNSKDLLKKLEATREPPSKMFIQEEEGLEPKEMLRKMEAKEEPPTKMFIRKEGALDSKEMPRKLKAKEEPPTKKSSRKEGTKDSKVVIKAPEVKELKTKEKVCSYKATASVPLNHKPKRKEATNKKTEKAEKVSSDRRKPLEKENVKSIVVSRTQDHAKTTSTKLQKPKNEKTFTKNKVLHQGSTTRHPQSTYSKKPVSQNSVDQMKKNRTKKAKPVRESSAIRAVAKNSQCKDGDKEINLACEMDSTSTITSTLLTDQLSAEEGTEASQIHTKDHSENNQNSLCEVTTQISQHEGGIEPEEDANQLTGHKTTERETVRTKAELRALLLSSAAFLSCVEELFDLNVNQSIFLQNTVMEEDGMINVRLLLDCANELMEQRKSLRTSEVAHPFLWILNPRINITLEQLMEEVCDGVELLRSYSKVGGDVLFTDSLYVMLERDLKGKGGVLSSVWELGWMYGFSVDEAGKVVAEMEKQLLDGLIEEVLIDVMF